MLGPGVDLLGYVLVLELVWGRVLSPGISFCRSWGFRRRVVFRLNLCQIGFRGSSVDGRHAACLRRSHLKRSLTRCSRTVVRDVECCRWLQKAGFFSHRSSLAGVLRNGLGTLRLVDSERAKLVIHNDGRTRFSERRFAGRLRFNVLGRAAFPNALLSFLHVALVESRVERVLLKESVASVCAEGHEGVALPLVLYDLVVFVPLHRRSIRQLGIVFCIVSCLKEFVLLVKRPCQLSSLCVVLRVSEC